MPDAKPMHILLSAYACLPDAGTEPGHGWNWATHLAARGMEVSVLTRKQNHDRIEQYLRENPIPRLRFFYVDVPGKTFRETSGMHYFLWQWLAVGAAKKIAMNSNFDIIHHVTYGSIHVPSQLWRLGKPIIFGPVGGGQIAPSAMLRYFGGSKNKERMRSLFTRMLRFSPFHLKWLRRMSAVLATNRDTLRLLKGFGCERASFYFDTGLPENFLASSPRIFTRQEGPLRLLWVGRLLPRKALPLALDAIAQVCQSVSLTIVGDGLDPAVVKGMIAERKLENRVKWLGRLSWFQVRDEYMKHDALLFTSLRETGGAQLLESMALGLPVITLDLHGPRELVPTGAGLKVAVTTPTGTIKAIAQAIDEYASLGAEAKSRMSEVAWNFALTMTWDRRAEFAEGLYKTVLSRSSSLNEVGKMPVILNA